MANEVTTKPQDQHPAVVLRGRLEARTAEIRAAMPGIPPDRFIRAVMTAAQINPDILACSFNSIWLSCMKACRDGLLPDGVEAALVPYKSTASYIPMYKGLLRKFQESGEFKWIAAMCVYDGDEFAHYIDETGEHLRHVPSDVYDDKKINKVYAIAHSKSGGIFITVLPLAEINKIRKVSKTTREDAPWNMWFPEMAKKTALRRLSKMLPSAPVFDDEDDVPESLPVAPQLHVAASRPVGAAAALDLFGSSDESESDAPTQSASGETGGGEQGGPVTTTTGPATAADVRTEAPSNDTTSAAQDDADMVTIARGRGRAAKTAGQSRKAMPGEYRDPKRGPEADAWLAGYDEKSG